MAGIDIGYELSAFIPSIGVGLLFWFALRSIMRADRAERVAAADWERSHHGDPATVEASTVEASTVEASTVEGTTAEASTVDATTVDAATVERSES